MTCHIGYRKALKTLFFLLAGGLTTAITSPGLAETLFISELEQFGVTPLYGEELIILPTRMMDDEELFLAAKIQRENRMSAGQRLINNYWLLANHNNTYRVSGGASLARFLREGLIDYWKRTTSHTDQSILAINERSDVSVFGSYKLHVSSDEVTLAYEYRF